ncbi:hypothetical protein VTL71DRAFT_2367 [Oculimacula yallundae]|uniref:Uncharacterized protein n=1 Tax=Oculimacula yallundae TaxID=86028 RepID=A0ABR4C8N8_9HELO
MSITFYYN